jgi:hypothetical protein
MNISEMIMVLKAYERGEKLEYRLRGESKDSDWQRVIGSWWNFAGFEYRIAPKKEPTLVEELRLCAESGGVSEETLIKAADRICELERVNAKPIDYYTADELLTEIKRRMG